MYNDRNLPDAPWIRNCERWGYPQREDTIVMCDVCGQHFDVAYDDYKYEGGRYICHDCMEEDDE